MLIDFLVTIFFCFEGYQADTAQSLFSAANTVMPGADPAIEAMQKAEHLSKETRRVYSSKLGIIANASGNQPLLRVLVHYPNKVIQYITRSYTEIASQKTMLVSVMAVFRLLNIKVKAKSSYDSYLAYFDKLDAVLRDRSKTNLLSKRQAAGFITHAELQLVREKLPDGSKERDAGRHKAAVMFSGR